MSGFVTRREADPQPQRHSASDRPATVEEEAED